MTADLHIYGQPCEHFPAQIIGNREGLMVLRQAIDAALAGELAACDAFQNDGEGYQIEVRLVTDAWLQLMPNHYTDDAERPWTEEERAAFGAALDGRAGEAKPEKRNNEQNALLHAILTEIAETREWAGQKRDVEVWKRLLTAAWLRTRGESVEVLPAIDGHGIDVVFRRTSTLTKAECAELITYIEAWRAGA